MLVITVVATFVTTAAALLHGALEKADLQTHRELRHGATELAPTLRSRVQSQHFPKFDTKEESKRWRYSPRMFVSEGCDGSTAIMTHAFKILNLHGIWTTDPESQKELLDPDHNPYIKNNTNIVTAMKSMKDVYQKQRKTLVFKAILTRDSQAALNRSLLDLGTYAAFNTRRNSLDHLVCMIRDCFLDTDVQTTPYGYPVDSHGQPSGVCFGRRTEGDSSDKANIKIPSLGDNLMLMETMTDNVMQMLKDAGYKPAFTSMEDMIAFEESADGIDTSFKAWKTLLGSWGIDADDAVLKKYLKSEAGTWKPESQRASLYNADAVFAELKRLGRTDLIRT